MVTVTDIARECGVSHTTVVRALNNTGRISAKTRERIIEKAREMDYRPDILARVFAKGRSMMLGIIVPDLKNQYFPTMLDAMSECARQSGYQLSIGLHQGDRDIEHSLINTLTSYRIDGLILAMTAMTEELEQFLLTLPEPVILLGYKASRKIACIGIDEQQAANDITVAIIAAGYRKIAFVVPMDKFQHTIPHGHMQRYRGVCQAAAAADSVKVEVVPVNDDFADRVIAMIQRSDEKIGVLCSGEYFADHIIRRAREREMLPKRDYGIAAFDHMEIYEKYDYRLTTIDNAIDQIGFGAVETTIQMIENKADRCRNMDIPYRVIEGDTL